MTWFIHTGPFPLMTSQYDGDLWLWRLTDGDHFTAVIVRIGRSILDADEASLDASTLAARRLRGRNAVAACLTWPEPPREITVEAVRGPPAYWGGVQPS